SPSRAVIRTREVLARAPGGATASGASSRGAANAAVDERAPRGDEEGHQVGEGNLPQQGARPRCRQQHVTLIDDQEQRADDEGDRERSLEHRPVAKRAAPALHDRALARLEDEGGGAAVGGAARGAGRGGRRLAHGSILVRRRERAAAVFGARPARGGAPGGLRGGGKEGARDSPLPP